MKNVTRINIFLVMLWVQSWVWFLKIKLHNDLMADPPKVLLIHSCSWKIPDELTLNLWYGDLARGFLKLPGWFKHEATFGEQWHSMFHITCIDTFDYCTNFMDRTYGLWEFNAYFKEMCECFQDDLVINDRHRRDGRHHRI